MRPEMIALDIDGTLFDSRGRISERNLRAVSRCVRSGIEVVFATGRDYDALPLEQVSGTGMRYAVTTNGSAIYEICGRRCVWENTMRQQDILDIISYVSGRDVFPYMFIDGKGYAAYDKEEVFERVNWPPHLKTETRKNIHFVTDLAELVKSSDRGVQKGAILFPGADGITGWEEMRAYLDSIPGIHAVDGGCANLEFNRSDATKADGLARLAGMRGISLTRTLAIGDSENDIELLKACAVGVAMGNAPEPVKTCADCVTFTNDEDGVAAVLEELTGGLLWTEQRKCL